MSGHTDRSRRAAFVGLLCLALTLALANSTAPSPIYGLYRQMWGLSSTMMTALFAVYSAGTLATLLFISLAGRRLPRLGAVCVGVAGIAASAAMIAFAGGPETVLAARTLAGIATGLVTGAANMLLMDEMRDGAGKAAAVLGSIAFTGGCVVGPLLSVAAMHFEVAPTRLAFEVIAVVSVLCLAGLVLVHATRGVAPTSDEGVGPPDRGGGTVRFGADFWFLRSRVFWAAAGALAISWATGGLFMAVSPIIARELAGIVDPRLAGLVAALFQLVAGISQYAMRRAASQAALVAGVAALAVALCACAFSSWIGSPLMFVAAAVLAAAGYGAAFVGAASLVNGLAGAPGGTNAVSAFYAVGYVTNSLPVIGFGIVVDRWGMLPAIVAFAALWSGGAAVAGLGALLRRR